MRTDRIPQGWLGQQIDLADAKRHAPPACAPAEVHQSWQAFLEKYEWRYDEVWSYHSCYDDKLAAMMTPQANGWAGFVLLRLGEIVASYDIWETPKDLGSHPGAVDAENAGP